MNTAGVITGSDAYRACAADGPAQPTENVTSRSRRQPSGTGQKGERRTGRPRKKGQAGQRRRTEEARRSPLRLGQWRRRGRSLRTTRTRDNQLRPQDRCSAQSGRHAQHTKFEELELPAFLQEFEFTLGTFLGLLPAGDCLAYPAGVLPVKSGVERLGDRNIQAPGNEHPGPSRGLQDHPVSAAQIERTAEKDQFVESGPHEPHSITASETTKQERKPPSLGAREPIAGPQAFTVFDRSRRHRGGCASARHLSFPTRLTVPADSL
jgi:hypothetical protein